MNDRLGVPPGTGEECPGPFPDVLEPAGSLRRIGDHHGRRLVESGGPLPFTGPETPGARLVHPEEGLRPHPLHRGGHGCHPSFGPLQCRQSLHGPPLGRPVARICPRNQPFPGELRNIGPVPLLKFRAVYCFDSGLYLGTEIDGFYAPVKYLNGGRGNTVGAIVDMSIRAGLKLHNKIDSYLNLRYLGGGATGGEGSGYTKNWLHFMLVTIGIELRVL